MIKQGRGETKLSGEYFARALASPINSRLAVSDAVLASVVSRGRAEGDCAVAREGFGKRCCEGVEGASAG